MLIVERSNRTEKLLAGLARRWSAPRRDPLMPSLVVVQGPGMERWIAQSLARELGVCAHTEFLFPRNLFERVLGAGEGRMAADPRWEPRQLVWWLARRLEAHRGDPELERLAPHLVEAVDGDWRLIQLAHQIATLFDRYITDRPDQVLRWPDVDLQTLENEERWQAWLFRRLLEDLGSDHLAGRAEAFFRALHAPDAAAFGVDLKAALPDAIEVFAVSTLAPLYLRVLDGLASVIDVHLSVLSPSRAYWGDLWQEQRDEALRAPAGTPLASDDGFPSPALGAAAGLLVGLGRLGGDFQACLEQETSYQESDLDLFEDPTAGRSCPSLLARLQANLLDLEDGWGGAPVAREDDSIQVHLCHGAKRELEVLEGLLRDAFERDPTLTPEDVIVMAPRIDTLAPYVEAVFGVPGDAESVIPHRIADRGTFRRSPVAEAFALLLELLSGRAGRSEVLGWLAREPARTRFGLDADDVERLAEWAERAGIRFGLDAAHRAQLGLRESPDHTWSGGLDRLALAHAVGASEQVMAGLLPEPLDAFADPALLGAAGELEACLSAARREIGRPRKAVDWCDWLGALLEETLAYEDANAHEHLAIRGILLEIRTAAAAAGFDSPVPFEAMRERLDRALEGSPPPQGFLSGGVTFCELVPLRAIPFRVIAILGLGDADFPRGRPAPGYDLVARHPRAGDRSPRQDDRHLFLEALLCARDRFILTVPGRDLRDGSNHPPSVVVSELLDALADSFTLAPSSSSAGSAAHAATDDRSLRDWLVVEHPLQSFSARYFEVERDPRLGGGDREAFEGAAARRAARLAEGGRRRRFLDGIVPLLAFDGRGSLSETPRLELEALCDRILRSTQHFARDRLGLRMPRPEQAVGDLDPIAVAGLDRYRLGTTVMEHLEAGASIEDVRRRLQASPLLPAGLPGSLALQDLQREVVSMLSLAKGRRGGVRLEDRPFELELEVAGGLGSSLLTGKLVDLWPGGQVRLRYARIRGAGELELWIRHLVLCALTEADEGEPDSSQSFLIGRPATGSEGSRVVSFAPVPAPRPLLARLFEWAWSADTAPLPFFPRSSRRYATKKAESDEAIAWREAHGELFGRDAQSGQTPEIERDLETQRIWEGGSPLAASDALPLVFRFDELATRFFEPLLEVRRESAE